MLPSTFQVQSIFGKINHPDSYLETFCITYQLLKCIIHYLTLRCLVSSCKVDALVKLLQNK